MDDHKETQLVEKFKGFIEAGKRNSKRIGRIISLVLCIIVVISIATTIKRSNDYGKVRDENKRLQEELSDAAKAQKTAEKELESAQNKLTSTQEQLEYAENQVGLLEESTNALVQQVGELEKKVSDLEELLNIKDKPPVIERKQLEEQLETLGELVTAKYFYRNATRQTDSKTWLWGWTMPFSDTSLLATYDGTIKAGINFNEIKIDINESSRTITVILPDCKITDNNIPQETINVLEVKDNLFNEVTFNDYNQFISAEKDVMEERAIEQGLLTEAKEEAKATIKAFLSLVPGMDTYTLIVR